MPESANACHRCGATLAGGARFRPHCGQALDAAALPTMTPPVFGFFTATRGRTKTAWLDG
jgi:hypothetical protein